MVTETETDREELDFTLGYFPPIESSDDYFADEVCKNIPSTSASTLDPLDILCQEVDDREATQDIEEYDTLSNFTK